MNRFTMAGVWFALLAAPALGAVNKDGGKPAVNPCLERDGGCAEAAPVEAVREPVVIYLDHNGEELVRMPLSQFRAVHPKSDLPETLPGIDE